MEDETEDIPLRDKATALSSVARYRPQFSVGLVALGGLVAVLEGVGLSFIYPIIQVAQSEGPVNPQGPIMEAFVMVYRSFGVPFTLGYLVLGIATVMGIRFASSFLVDWLRGILQKRYEGNLRSKAFDAALDAEISYFDSEGSDDILNAIITETRYSGRVIREAVLSLETGFLVAVYFAIMVYIAPEMTLLAIILLGGITLFLRKVIEPGYTVGSRVAESNEGVQRAVQAGTQGIRDVKLFGLIEEVYEEFSESIQRYTQASIRLERNKAALKNGYDFAAALTLFALIYIAFSYSGLSLGGLGIFLFAMYRLSPLASRLNSQVYSLEGDLSHLVRTQTFLHELNKRGESGGNRPISGVQRIEFDNVSFMYGDEEKVLSDISFDVQKGEFIAFVGQSGAGKSTIVSLLTRMYYPEQGEIRADGISIEEFELGDWRSRLAVVRQNPFIFNDTLENNIKVGNRSASQRDVDHVCEIAKIDEFIDELPNKFQTLLGDDGVRLSGGQRQRVAIARALLKDADFLILDEATSDLDSNLEKQVQAAIESMHRDYGIIAIAHRLSTVKNADRIYTFEDGEIIETGNHDELLNNDGPYAELYTIQSELS